MFEFLLGVAAGLVAAQLVGAKVKAAAAAVAAWIVGLFKSK